MKILIADDSALSRHVLRDVLTSWDYEVIETRDGLEAWDALRQEGGPRLSILDWYMPGMDGLDVCRRLRDQANASYRYVILLTSNIERRAVVEGLQAGADDYLVKPFDADELEQRIRAGIRILDLEDRLLAAQASLRFQATHDGLTQVLNRAAILEHLHDELCRAQRESASLGVLMVDVDHFKSINDSFGHQAGDEVLRRTAERIREALRPYDRLGRYGGEEFLVLLPGASAEEVDTLAERLRARLSDQPVRWQNQRLAVTASIGACAVTDEMEMAEHTVIQCADEALYRAKETGRNRVCMAAVTHRDLVIAPCAALES